MNVEEIFERYEKLLKESGVKEAGIYLESRAREAEEEAPLAAASCWNELTGYWRACGDKEKSYASAERALAILGAKRLAESRHYAVALLNFATAKTAFGDTDGALELYEKVEERFKKTEGVPDYQRAALCNSKAQLLLKRGETAEAERYFEESLALLEGMEDAGSEIATCSANMAYCAMARKELAEAEGRLARAENYFKDAQDDPHANVALSCRGQLEFLRGNCAAAAASFEKLAANIEGRYGRNANYALAQRSAAKAFEAAGDVAKAANCRALAESVPEHGENDAGA